MADRDPFLFFADVYCEFRQRVENYLELCSDEQLLELRETVREIRIPGPTDPDEVGPSLRTARAIWAPLAKEIAERGLVEDDEIYTAGEAEEGTEQQGKTAE